MFNRELTHSTEDALKSMPYFLLLESTQTAPDFSMYPNTHCLQNNSQIQGFLFFFSKTYFIFPLLLYKYQFNLLL